MLKVSYKAALTQSTIGNVRIPKIDENPDFISVVGTVLLKHGCVQEQTKCCGNF